MNNINFENMEKAIEAIKADRSLGLKTWSADISWEDGVKNNIKIRDFDPILVDEPANLGGSDQGPNPVELLVGAAGSCFIITFEVMASQMGIELEEVKVNIEADMNAGVFMGIEEGEGGIYNPRIKLDVKSNASKEKLDEIAQMALKKSPVLLSLGMAVDLI